MRARSIAILVATGLLAGCGRPGPGGPDGARGRFAGIGVFDAGPVWHHMVAPDPAKPALARLDDDEHVIVVVDSRTGEVRQCGDHSGYCVATNPWAGAPPASLPASLRAHAAEIDAGPAAPAKANGHQTVP